MYSTTLRIVLKKQVSICRILVLAWCFLFLCKVSYILGYRYSAILFLSIMRLTVWCHHWHPWCWLLKTRTPLKKVLISKSPGEGWHKQPSRQVQSSIYYSVAVNTLPCSNSSNLGTTPCYFCKLHKTQNCLYKESHSNSFWASLNAFFRNSSLYLYLFLWF